MTQLSSTVGQISASVIRASVGAIVRTGQTGGADEVGETHICGVEFIVEDKCGMGESLRCFVRVRDVNLMQRAPGPKIRGFAAGAHAFLRHTCSVRASCRES